MTTPDDNEGMPDDLERLREEVAEYEQLTGRLVYLLTATANALKGPPRENTLHDWSDLPYVARRYRKLAQR